MTPAQIAIAEWILKKVGFILGNSLHKKWEKQLKKSAEAKKVAVILALLLLNLSGAGCMSFKQWYVDTWHDNFPDPVVTNGVPHE